MIGLETASAELDRLMTADAASANSPATTVAPNPSATPEAQRAAPTTEPTAKPNSASTDTPATTDPQGQQQQTQTTPKPGEQPAAKEPTRYEKARARQDNAWKQINDEKAAIKAERERLERDRSELSQRQQQDAAQYTPDQYDQAAKKFEEQGKFDLADAARARAAELRKNPPPTPQQQEVLREQQERHQAQMKEWWGKASVDYPEVAKAGSPANAALRTFLAAEPDAVRSPKGMYYAARLVNAETAAARVPGLEQELGALRAKVKELEALTGPGPTALPAQAGRTAEKSEAEQFADLERQAMEMGPLSR